MAERPFESPPDIKAIDARVESPNDRALRVWRALKDHNFSDYDLLCFGLENSARISIEIGEDILYERVRHALQRLYAIHYNYPEVISGIHEVESISRADADLPSPGSEGQGRNEKPRMEGGRSDAVGP